MTKLLTCLRKASLSGTKRLDFSRVWHTRFSPVQESRRNASNNAPVRNNRSDVAKKGLGIPEAGLQEVFGADWRRVVEPEKNLNKPEEKEVIDITYHFHVYSTKHNTHITLTQPNRAPLMSVSAGNIGFKKAARGTYDAAYQLTAYVIGRIQEEGLLTKIIDMEVVLRGFGVGREAVTKAILGAEGRLVREKVKKVTDATRLKFGGTRSPKPRRLG